MRPRVPLALALLAALAVAVGAALPGRALGRARPRTHDVVIRGYAFHPARLTIGRGDSVTWLWRDGSIPHNVTASGFRGSPTKAGGSFTVRFSRRGTFAYTCTIHPWMDGRIVVR